MVEHSIGDREVGGSIPLAPFSIIMGYLSKDINFDVLKINLVHYFELRRQMNDAYL